MRSDPLDQLTQGGVLDGVEPHSPSQTASSVAVDVHLAGLADRPVGLRVQLVLLEGHCGLLLPLLEHSQGALPQRLMLGDERPQGPPAPLPLPRVVGGRREQRVADECGEGLLVQPAQRTCLRPVRQRRRVLDTSPRLRHGSDPPHHQPGWSTRNMTNPVGGPAG